MTYLTVLKVLGQTIDDWGYSFGDTLTFEMSADYKVKSMKNGAAIDLTSDSASGVMSLEKWTDYLISRMYYGSITDCQKDSGAENPDNHLVRDTTDSETNMQWW